MRLVDNLSSSYIPQADKHDVNVVILIEPYMQEIYFSVFPYIATMWKTNFSYFYFLLLL